jgi:two-component system, NtrC family, sensor kinase
VVGRALLEARPQLVEDMQAEPGRARPDLDTRSGIRSYLAAPLVWRGDTLGVVTVASPTPGFFGEADTQLVAELAEQAAAAVAHARAYADEQARRAQLEELNRTLAQAQHRLVQLEKIAAIGQLANGIAHELNTPLSVVISNLSVLKDYCASLTQIATGTAIAQSEIDYILEDLPNLIEESTASARHIADIVRSVALFARSGDSDKFSPVNVEEALEAAITLAWNELKHRGHVEREFGGVPKVLGNASELSQAFVNLLLNAAESLDERGGVVRVNTSVQEGHVVVRIVDNGRGIPPENLPRVFEPFFTTRGVAEGTGLGLSVCHGIVTRHGGTIDIQSARGSGTTVSVHLVTAP